MKHTTTALIKFKRLVRELRPTLGSIPLDPETIAVGILERLWHTTIRECRNGRIGEKLSRDDIAEAVGWHGDTDSLVNALIHTGWIDDDGGVMMIHDWERVSRDCRSTSGRRLDLGTAAWKRMRDTVIIEDGLICRYCGHDCSNGPTVDHVVPVVLGGGIDRSNLVVACRSCNGRKGDRLWHVAQ